MAVKKSQVVVHILVALFGVGSWLAINGSFVELPLMVLQLPEGWTLASYIAVMTQLGNIGPLVVALYNRFSKRKLSDSVVVYVIYAVGAVACLLLAFFWDHVVEVLGKRRSMPFFVLVFFQALVDCTSSVVFLPFMATLKAQYMTTLFVGQGLSGVIPALVGLIQGAGEMTCKNVTNSSEIIHDLMTTDCPMNLSVMNNATASGGTHWHIQPEYAEPLFGVFEFYVFLCVLTVVCGMAFILINKLSLCRSEYIQNRDQINTVSESTERTPLREDLFATEQQKNATAVNPTKGTIETPLRENPLRNNLNDSLDTNVRANAAQDDEEQRYSDISLVDISPRESTDTKDKLLTKTVVFVLFVFLIINALTNGVLVSVQPYATMPYSLNTYHIITILFKIIPVFATSLAYVKAINNIPALATLLLLGVAGSVYIITAAAFSPDPWLARQTSGAVIMACVWTLTSALFSYISVCAANIGRTRGRRALFWCGVVKQVGSACGSLVMFLLVFQGDVFESAPKCP